MILAAMRSKLFVPGSRPELFAKALAGAADALSLDLEDAVAPDRKGQAREAVATFLGGLPAGGAGKVMIVRVNGLDTPHFAEDVAAVVRPGLDVLNLPAAESADDVRAAAAAIEHAGDAAGRVGLLVNIETPKGLRLAAEIATAHPRVVGLQIGYGDLFEPAGMDRADDAALGHVRVAVRLAASEAGIPAFDGSLAAIASPDRLRAEAEAARRLGFAGKSCIHPSQVPVVNEVFRPRPEEIARAREIVAAAEDAAARGVGAFTVAGQMVDAPFIERARAVLRLVGNA